MSILASHSVPLLRLPVPPPAALQLEREDSQLHPHRFIPIYPYLVSGSARGLHPWTVGARPSRARRRHAEYRVADESCPDRYIFSVQGGLEPGELAPEPNREAPGRRRRARLFRTQEGHRVYFSDPTTQPSTSPRVTWRGTGSPGWVVPSTTRGFLRGPVRRHLGAESVWTFACHDHRCAECQGRTRTTTGSWGCSSTTSTCGGGQARSLATSWTPAAGGPPPWPRPALPSWPARGSAPTSQAPASRPPGACGRAAPRPTPAAIRRATGLHRRAERGIDAEARETDLRPLRPLRLRFLGLRG